MEGGTSSVPLPANRLASERRMSELFFERGLFATLAAALVVPELTTFLIFVYVMLTLSTLLARQLWSFVLVPLTYRSPGAVPTRPPAEAHIRLFPESTARVLE